MSHDLLVQMAYSIVSHQLRYKICSINVSVFLMSFFNVVIGSNGPQKFCIEKVGKETWLPRSHTWQVSSYSVNSKNFFSLILLQTLNDFARADLLRAANYERIDRENDA